MFGFNVNKLKPNLKMAVHRIAISKTRNRTLTQRREVARLLADGKEEKARIRKESFEITYDGRLRYPGADVQAARRASGSFDGCLDDIRSTDANFVFQS
ncbi:hypothetical protein PsorP6_000537 [Peronosclerospora sorghi]|uniref:Uncharacterized protein n=1 Tax=Peronosclerospora sorghi TaxID=230839 RepID=A0ACC0WPV0_9STRA|nr:hypothetical protein PsorP6_000537 [Peronosclerospora sorghi]